MTPSAHTIKELWLAAMQGEGRSPYTLAEYRREVTRLLDAYPGKTIFDIDTFDVEMHLPAARDSPRHPTKGARRHQRLLRLPGDARPDPPKPMPAAGSGRTS